ncbi:hypothetical protein [Nocardia veterana]|uniref:Uncharacterized protein n=1 Tax=Nocardia veterana TaxID=132249 RepID=A0A7X6RGJ9_9NOCA|nr:hypothetical protein [Nocardia veterana]NKY84995.1 hypothetical protein [Nocardia veterana]
MTGHSPAPDPLREGTAASGHYWVVDLEPPPAASTLLSGYIHRVRNTMQKLVDLLGTPALTRKPPAPKPPEPVPVDHDFVGSAAAEYQVMRGQIATHVARWQEREPDIHAVSAQTSTIAEAVLEDIKHTVAQLRHTLRTAGSTPTAHYQPVSSTRASGLSLAVEQVMTEAVSDAMEDVYDSVLVAEKEVGLSTSNLPKIPDEPFQLMPPVLGFNTI